MKIIKPKVEIMTPIDTDYVLKFLESVGRTCYKSEDSITGDSADKFVRGLISRGHEAMLEHFSFSVRFTVDRGVTHEQVRHRIASFAQESTRYCNYAKDKFNNEITAIDPSTAMGLWVGKIVRTPSGKEIAITVQHVTQWLYLWRRAITEAEMSYMEMIENGCPAELARGVLPTSLKTEIVVTMNLREWRHFFKLRAVGTTGLPHPQMSEVSEPLLEECYLKLPAVFGDIWEDMKPKLRYADKSGMAYTSQEVLQNG